MKKTFTKTWLRAFALIALMLTTSMVASAIDRYYLRGGADDDSPGWTSNNYMLRPYNGSSDKYYIDFKAISAFAFKIVKVADGTDEEVWIGSTSGGYEHEAKVFPYTFTGVRPNDGDRMVIGKNGTYRFIYDITNEELQLTYVPVKVVLSDYGQFENGIVTADKAMAVQGDTVTLTVTPNYGYVCDKDKINIKLTIDAGNAQAPQRAPQVGETFHPEGDARATNDAPATYTFTMPEYPLSVLIMAEFQEVAKHQITLIDKEHCTITTNQPDNDAVPEGTMVTVTPNATPAEDFFADRLDILISGQGELEEADIEVTTNSDGTFSFVMPDYDIVVTPHFRAYLHGVEFAPLHNRWATYYGAYNLEVPQDVTAYLVTGVENDEVTIEETSFIPMNTGVLLYSEQRKDKFSTEYRDEIETGATSLLRGFVDEEMAVGGYVLYEDKFILTTSGVLPLHRCFLNIMPAGAPFMLKIVRPGEGGVVTGVESINASDVVSVKYVNLSGMTSDKPFDGVNVKVITRADGTTETSKIIK